VDLVRFPPSSPAPDLPDLRERRLDLVLARVTSPSIGRVRIRIWRWKFLLDDPMVLARSVLAHPLCAAAA
jgi:hypothetical protein